MYIEIEITIKKPWVNIEIEIAWIDTDELTITVTATKIRRPKKVTGQKQTKKHSGGTRAKKPRQKI
jgi:hypothetical protein